MANELKIIQEDSIQNMLTKIKNNNVLLDLVKNHKEFTNYVINNNTKSMFKLINHSQAKLHFEERFFNFYSFEIIQELRINESYPENIFKEYEKYKEKLSYIPNQEKLTYEEIIAFEFDKDKITYEEDFNRFEKILKSIKNLYLYGNAGNGKTTFAYKMSEKMQLKLYNINSVKNEFSLKGFFNLEGEYQLSQFETWYKEGGILLLDECDSYSSNGMLYLNNAIEINSKSVTLDNGETIQKNPDCYVIACANTNGLGRTSDYIGRNTIDKAFLSRFLVREFKEYTYIHKQILKDNFKTFKNLFESKRKELTCRDCVKISRLLENFTILETKEIFTEELEREV